jgi:hypothetical protein
MLVVFHGLFHTVQIGFRQLLGPDHYHQYHRVPPAISFGFIPW